MLIIMPVFMMGMVGFIFPSGQSLGPVTLAVANIGPSIRSSERQVATSGLLVNYLEPDGQLHNHLSLVYGRCQGNDPTWRGSRAGSYPS